MCLRYMKETMIHSFQSSTLMRKVNNLQKIQEYQFPVNHQGLQDVIMNTKETEQ